ncbi:MAG TPA: hypothetical protein EYP63_01800 [Desulfotomaculum sp.]|nr:hypothetical protein [Desulfotomaculum sp.]
MKGLIASIFGKNSMFSKKPEYWVKLGLLAVVGFFLLVLGGTGGSAPVDPGNAVDSGAPGHAEAVAGISQEEEQLAERVKAVLQSVRGAGAVEVSIRLAGSTKTEHAVNTSTGKRVTEEKEKTGLNRTTSEKTQSGEVVIVRDGQREKAVIENEKAPRILGVLIVAEGAADPPVKAEIFRAAQVALGVEAHRILVLPRRSQSGLPAGG